VNWELIASTLTILAAASGLIVYLLKTIFAHLLTRDVERYRGELKVSHDTALERLRADLRIQAFERETTFEKLHAKRVEVIAELYRHIVTVQGAMQDLMSPLQLAGAKEEDKFVAASTAGRAFVQFFEIHKIYFSEELCSTLQAFSDKLWDAWITFGTYGKDEEGVARERRDARISAWRKLNGEVSTHKAEIEKAFRVLLGQIDKKDPT
jgi:hypothetical protein